MGVFWGHTVSHSEQMLWMPRMLLTCLSLSIEAMTTSSSSTLLQHVSESYDGSVDQFSIHRSCRKYHKGRRMKGRVAEASLHAGVPFLIPTMIFCHPQRPAEQHEKFASRLNDRRRDVQTGMG